MEKLDFSSVDKSSQSEVESNISLEDKRVVSTHGSTNDSAREFVKSLPFSRPVSCWEKGVNSGMMFSGYSCHLMELFKY